jgi:hypothetical protein
MALLPFLGAGQTHELGKYQQTVADGLRWLCADQQANGSFRSISGGNMYAHAQASIALCEALAMTGDPELLTPAERAITYIVQAQHSAGGWRYQPKSPGDTSVMGWQILALRSAQAAGLEIPGSVFELAGDYLDTAQTDDDGGLYAYMPTGRRPQRHTPAMTAEGLLCRQYTGWSREEPGLAIGARYLLSNLPDQANPNIYYWYYATQVLHHLGGEDWSRWNERIRETLIAMQQREGHLAGSWTPRGGHSDRGGRVYMTALAICTLEIYYRHVALYEE